MRRPGRTSAAKAAAPLRKRILDLLGTPDYQPLDKVELTRKLGLTPDDRARLRTDLRAMEQEGKIARIRKDRYVIPREANLLTGILRVSRGGNARLDCGQEPHIPIPAQYTGTALHGDRVVARMVHEGVRQRLDSHGRPTAQVIRILERANSTIVGTLQSSKRFFYVVPDDPRITHDIYVTPDRDATERRPNIGDKVVVRMEEWTSPETNPEGHIIEVLGPASEPGVDMLAIIRRNNLPTEFPEPVLAEAHGIPETVGPGDAAGREDLRNQLIITIDPDDARDFDDAIHVEPLSGGGWRLGVHIADVSHYVRTGGALDREAVSRGNSVYLADRVIPMLPERLSNGVCSLKPRVDRLTFSAFIDFTAAGKIKSARFARTIIHSKARLTYKQAYAILSGSAVEPVPARVPDRTDIIAPEVEAQLRTAWELASLLRKNRFQAGSLDLDFPEVKVWLDEKGRPARLEKVENDISHQLIEEFMLAANEVVAREIKNRVLPCIYRIHDDPDPGRLKEFREVALGYGLHAGDLTNRAEVQKLLSKIRGMPEEYALKLAFLKSLKRAEYGVEPRGHYGLAKVNYTHFTSPIRRYADLVVHRVLAQITSQRKIRPASKDLPEVAEHISTTERIAADAEKESVRLKKLEFFQAQLRSRKPEEYEAVIIDVKSFGLIVELPAVILTGMIHVSTLRDDFYLFDPVRLSFVGRRRRKIYRAGGRLRVIVDRVDAHKQQIDFAPVG
ncbi:MAG TPA: ribonuclease R [Chthoniobacteraceae bacterium]|jgi:ribonuclease R|nr:ribonuclease R [Chthoniobacteraceae bacterium]